MVHLHHFFFSSQCGNSNVFHGNRTISSCILCHYVCHHEIFRDMTIKLECKNMYGAKLLLYDALRFHIRMKRWFKKYFQWKWIFFKNLSIFSLFSETANLYGSPILMHLACGMIFMGSAALQLNYVIIFWIILAIWKRKTKKTTNWKFDLQAIQNPSADLFILLIGTGVSVLNLFVYCYYGAVATENCLQFASSMYESNWYKLPTNLQFFIIMKLRNTQRPLYYRGWKLISLNLDTFCKVFSFHLLHMNIFEPIFVIQLDGNPLFFLFRCR